MVYLFNCMQELKAKERKHRSLGSFFQLVIGGKGNMYDRINITCPEDTILQEGINKGWSLGETKSGRPKLIKKEDDSICLIVSSKGLCRHKKDGYVSVLKDYENSIKVIASGDGLSYENGKGGWWDVHLIKVNKDDKCVFRIESSGSCYGISEDFIVIEDGKVHHVNFSDIRELYNTLGKAIPFSISNVGCIEEDEWKKLS